MVKVGDVWDSTTDVLAGRSGELLPIAALAFALPAIGQAAATAYGGTSPGMAVVNALIGLAAVIATLWGQLAVIAIASDPATNRQAAGRQALTRLPALILVVLVLVAAALALMLPVLIALAAAGYDFAAVGQYRGAGAMPSVPPGAALFVFFYVLALLIAGLWISARLVLVNVVVLNERRGVGALGRSVRLTRGMTLKLVGVVLLFAITYLVAVLALQSVVGLVFRLLLGAPNIATAIFMSAVAGAIFSAAFTAVVQVFAARLYAAITGAAQAPA